MTVSRSGDDSYELAARLSGLAVIPADVVLLHALIMIKEHLEHGWGENQREGGRIERDFCACSGAAYGGPEVAEGECVLIAIVRWIARYRCSEAAISMS